MLQKERPLPGVKKRDKNILLAVIKEFISTRRPTGSKFLNIKYNLGVSPATIRNVFASFEKKGFLTHSFHCSGRIPTTKGLRFYVDSILERGEIMNGTKIDELEGFCEEAALLKGASRILSTYSDWIGIAFSLEKNPEIRDCDIKLLKENRILLFIITDQGKIYEGLIKLPEKISKKTFAFIRKVVRSAKGKNAEFLKEKFRKLYEENRRILSLIEEKTAVLQQEKISFHTSISPSVFEKKRNSAAELFSVIGNERSLISQISDSICEPEHTVEFYHEMLPDEFKGLAIVLSNFKIGGTQYVCCVLGPQFMNYMRVLPLVKGTSRVVKKRLTEVL